MTTPAPTIRHLTTLLSAIHPKTTEYPTASFCLAAKEIGHKSINAIVRIPQTGLKTILQLTKNSSTSKAKQLTEKQHTQIKEAHSVRNISLLEIGTQLGQKFDEKMALAAKKTHEIEQALTHTTFNELLGGLSHLLEQKIPLNEVPFTHKIKHFDAPSWLALLLDSTYEPNGVEKLAEILSKFNTGGTEAISEKFIKEAEEYVNNTLDTLAKDTTFKTVPSGTAYVIADVAATFLGALSVIKGLEEFKHAKHEIKSLKTEKAHLKLDQKNLQVLLNTLNDKAPNGLRFAEWLNRSKLHRNAQGIQAAKLDAGIGLSAVGAGASSGLKGLSDIAVKSALAGKGLMTGKGLLGGASVIKTSTAAGFTATASGIASTVILGPLAGIFAVLLGGFFTRKTSIKLNQLKNDIHKNNDIMRDAVTAKLTLFQTPEQTEKNTDFVNYKQFIKEQGDKRTQFFGRFSKWNKAFLVGAGIYTASATAKAAIVAAAALGATAAASNPVGWGVLTGVGIVGAIALGASTIGFIKGHVRQTRYNQHTSVDHALVDRHFLVNAQNLRTQKTPEGAIPHLQGIDLAASCLKQLTTRETTLKGLLEAAAESTHTHAPFSEKLSVFQRLRGNTLGKTKFNQYLAEDSHFKNLIDTFVKPDLEAKTEYLKQKLQFRFEHKNEHTLNPEQLEEIAKSKHATQALKAYGSHLDRTQAKTFLDTNKLNRVALLRKELDKLSEPSTPEEMQPLNKTGIKKLLLEHWGAALTDKHGKALDSTHIDKLFAKHMVRTLRKDVEMAKGVLFEAQLQASRLREISTDDLSNGKTNLRGNTTEPTEEASNRPEIRQAEPEIQPAV